MGEVKLVETAQRTAVAWRSRFVKRDLEITLLREALVEVMSWITNWSPDFIENDEWKATDKKVSAVLPKE